MSVRLAPEELAGTAYRHDPTAGRFVVDVPSRANIAADTIGRHANGPRAAHPALIFEAHDGAIRHFSYRDVNDAANRLAVALRNMGVSRGDRVALHSVQRPETVIAHMAIYKLAAVATTVSQLTAADTLRYIMRDSGARVLITHGPQWAPLRHLAKRIGSLEHVVVMAGAQAGEIPFCRCLESDARGFAPECTTAEDPALLIYTSGSTGRPKGILHGHRILHALNATLELFYNLELREPDLVFWTAADWAWIGGLNDVVFPALTFGHSLVICEHRYDSDWALQFMARHGVTHILLTPTALKRLAQESDARERFDLSLRTIFTGGESLPGETHRALSRELGVVCNEGYGMSEVNQMIGNCQRLRPIKPGSMGWDFPGHKVSLVDDDGAPVNDGEVGEIVVADDDPTLFLGYWNQPELTAAMRLGDGWIRTHDLARKDADGYYWYQGRNDDLIKSAGYRIGPAEVEEALLEHPAVADAGVIGVPDDTGDRGSVVKAYVALAQGFTGDAALAKALREYVKAHIEAYKAPRSVEFVDRLPTTTTGKIARAELRQLAAKRRTGQARERG